MHQPSEKLDIKLNKIELLLLDVDGVLTDGSIIYDHNGEEIKAFHVKDGLGLRLLMQHGVKVAIATGRSSKALNHRCQDLGITHIFSGLKDKAALLNHIMDKTAVSADKIAFAGDDLPDLALMKKVGVAIAVADAHPTVRDQADLVTTLGGGKGAVREICEMILNAKNLSVNGDF